MFVTVQAEKLYDRVYRDMSEWVHWGPRAILRAMEPVEWGVAGFAEVDWKAAAMALQLGTQALLQSIEVLDVHFQLGVMDEVGLLIEQMTFVVQPSTEDL